MIDIYTPVIITPVADIPLIDTYQRALRQQRVARTRRKLLSRLHTDHVRSRSKHRGQLVFP